MKNYILFFIVTLFSLTVSAGLSDELSKIGAAFTDNLAVSEPGSFVGRSRTGISGGAIRKRIAHTNVSLFNATPPSYSMSCSGIDIHLGSFSFISGDQIRTMLTSIVQGTVSSAFMIALNQACPQCGQALADVQKWMQEANKFNMDTCKMSMQAAGALVGSFTKDEAQSNACATGNVKNNNAGDMSEAKQNGGACGSDKSASEIIAAANAAVEDCSSKPEAEKKACLLSQSKSAELFGNSLPFFLKVMGVVPMDDAEWGQTDFYLVELYMSTLGTLLNGASTPGTLLAQDVTDLFLCGVSPLSIPDSETNPVKLELKEHCGVFLNDLVPDLKIMQCVPTDSYDCGYAEPVDLREWVSDFADASGFPFTGDGLLRTIGSTLITMQNKAASGSGSFTAYEKYLLTVAPFPLYRILNLAAFYPGVADKLLSKNSNSLAVAFAEGMLKGLFDKAIKTNSVNNDPDSEHAGVSREILKDVSNQVNKFKMHSTTYSSSEQQWYNYNDLVTKQIIGLEKSLLRSNINALGGLAL